MWWAYRHKSFSIHLKRYFDRRDVDEAYESPFVDLVIEPFEAESHDAAWRIVQGELLGVNNPLIKNEPDNIFFDII